jgi:CRISPR-associated endoribonuclease Cas6
MLASLVLRLKPLEPFRSIPYATGSAARSFFYEAVTTAAPAAAQALHEATGLKPFTASLLRGPGRPVAGQRTIQPGSYTLHFTTLTSSLFAAFYDHLQTQQARGERVRLHGQEFAIEEVIFDGERVRFAQLETFESLRSRPPGQTFRFRFLSPTTFRSGDGHLPLPVPQSVYRSLWEKWNAFAPAALTIPDSLLMAVQTGLFPARFDLESELLEMGKSRVVGCVGACEYALTREVGEEERRWLTALTAFAFYAGVGAKTTVGLGQVEPEIDHAGEQK